MEFKLSTGEKFFDILPDDWQESIVPYWDEISKSANVYILEEKSEIIGGGIVFSTCPIDMQYAKTEAEFWLNKGYLYIGYIWISEKYRNQKLGSKWLKNLFQTNLKQNYFLTVEEATLISFYQKNGFKLIKSLQNERETEFLLTYNSLSV